MKFKRQIIDMGGSAYLGIPRELMEFENWKTGDAITLQDYEKKKGKFVAIYSETIETLEK